MMSKKEFAEEIVRRFCEENKIDRKDAHNHIYSSSRLAVALEFLGELNQEEKEYSITRGGTEYLHSNFDAEKKYIDTHFITTREMIDMLPDSVI